MGTICSKAVEKSVNAKVKMTDKVVGHLKEALAVAKDHTLEIPTYIQSMSTKLANNADD